MEKINFAEVVRNLVEEREIGTLVKTIEDGYIFSVPVVAKNVPSLRWNLRITENGSGKFWCYPAKEVSAAARPAVLECLNKLNDEYRFLRFCIDDDNDVSADYDFYLFGSEADGTAHLVGLMIPLGRILEQSYAKIMKTVWSAE